MMEFLKLSLFSACFLLSFTFSKGLSSLDSYFSIDDYTDGLITNIRTNPEFSTMKLPDYKTVTNVTIFGMSIYTHEVILSKGHLHELASIVRIGEATASYQDKIFLLNVTFQFQKLHSHYDFKYLVWNVGPSGMIFGDLEKVKVTFTGEMDVGSSTLNLKKFEIESPVAPKLSVDVSIFVNWILNPIINSLYSSSVLSTVHNKIGTWIEEYVEKFNSQNSTLTLFDEILLNTSIFL